jgi:uncharacterized RDD family membrane protein YckC
MAHSTPPEPAKTEPSSHGRKSSPRSDAWQALAWVVLGVATLVESLRMDRLEQQDINPYTIPGLLPACLGVAIILLGLLMAYRSIAQGALQSTPSAQGDSSHRHELRRIGVIVLLCCGFALGMVGHGLSFWLAAAVFITVIITILQHQALQGLKARIKGLLQAATIGWIAGGVITLVFQEFFLVRLP